jgi:FlaG protein
MDVQSAVASTHIWPVAPAATPAPAPAPAPTVASTPAVAPAPKSDSQSNDGSVGVSIGPTPGLATLPATSSGSKHGSDPSLAKGVAVLFNAQEQNVSVSFQVETDPNEIVTVFTDKSTGKVIVQFPSETMIALAKYFDHPGGSVVNKKV